VGGALRAVISKALAVVAIAIAVTIGDLSDEWSSDL
jgi:hypothetical protein